MPLSDEYAFTGAPAGDVQLESHNLPGNRVHVEPVISASGQSGAIRLYVGSSQLTGGVYLARVVERWANRSLRTRIMID